nr:flagellar assembly peptidoglycan hydrolase FlgJ [uncultured Tolumonas sp.]
MDKLTSQGLAGDIRNLDQLRQMGIKKDGVTSTSSTEGQQQALQAAARQFEAIFTQMWMKSMREANSELQDKDSPFNSSDTQFYQGMMDDQLAANVASGGRGSLADLIVKQLSPAKKQSVANTDPANHTLNMPTDHAAVMRRFAQADSATANNTTVPAGVLAAERFVSQNQAYKLPVSNSIATSGDSDSDQQTRFVRQLMPAAKMVASKMGLSPVALIAQAALETGWGKHMMSSGNSSSNNLFGVKAGNSWQGQKVSANSMEHVQGQAVVQRSTFRSYTSIVQSMQDYANLITGSDRYQQARAVAHDPDAYFDELQAAGYATDPDYAKKLKGVLRSDALQSVYNHSEQQEM